MLLADEGGNELDDFILLAAREIVGLFAAGAVTSMQLGNGRWESTVFNSRLQPVQIALGSTGTGAQAYDLLKLDYEYGATATANNGNVTKQTITVPSVTVGGTTHNGFTAVQNYVYDSLNRLDDAAEYIDANQTPSWRQDFSYDRYGNRNFVEANTTFEGFDKQCGNNNTELCPERRRILNPDANVSDNRLSTSHGYHFDAAGNIVRDSESRRFTYDGESKQVKVETLDANGEPVGTIGGYFFDGDGRRIKKHVPSTGEVSVFVYDAVGKMIGEYSTIAETEPANVSYTTADHLGSPRILTDQFGATISRRDFMPFGEEVKTPHRSAYFADSVRQKFTSYSRDAETDLDFAEARYYSFSVGRFSSPDPWPGTRHLPQSLNRYAYVVNNPLNFVDPSGLCGTTAGSPDDTPCIWLRNSQGQLMSVSQQQYDNRTGDEFKDYTPLTEEERQSYVGKLTGLNGDYQNDAEYRGFVADGTTIGLGSNGRFVAIPDPVREVPDFLTGQDAFSHGWFVVRTAGIPLYAGGDFAKQLVAAPLLKARADNMNFGSGDGGQQRKHCYVSCVATGISFGDPSSIAALGTVKEIVENANQWLLGGDPQYGAAVWEDSKRDMEANRLGQRLYYNFYTGGCKAACISQTP